MPMELKVPEVGESISEVQIGRWLKKAGDRAEQDEALVEIETDKVSFELPAPAAGTISKVLKEAGEPAQVGEVIGWFEAGEDGGGEGGGEAAERSASERSADEPAAKTKGGKAERASAAAKAPTGENAAKTDGGGGKRVMPAAKRVLAEKGISEDDVEGTGPGGRVLKEDAKRAAAAPAEAPVLATTPAGGDREEEIVPLSPLRRRLAERLLSAQQNAALLTTFNEIDMGAVKELRAEHGDAFKEKHGVKLGFTSFFVKAVIDALKLFPALNAEIRDGNVVYKNYYDVGVAVGGGKGLVVPVLRSAERLSFAEIEKTVADFAKRAEAGKLELAELTGGTFTISNGGVYGSLLSTPIVNPPQSGILGLHAIQDRPVGRDGQIVLRPMMYVALTYDHRIVDGREAVTFLRRVKDCVENPSRMLIEA